MLVNLINSSDFESFMLAAYSVALVRWVGGVGGRLPWQRAGHHAPRMEVQLRGRQAEGHALNLNN